jgi:Right handed beta helix region
MLTSQSATNALDAPASSGVTYFVSPNGLDTNSGTISSPWRSINHATSKDSPVRAGDTIQVEQGVYTELVTLDKSGDSSLGNITLKANGAVTLRDPNPNQGGFREGVIQSAGKSNWTIDGFRIENTSWAGISLRDARNMIVRNNYTYQTGASGIIVLPDLNYGGGDAEVTNSNIKILNNTIERANWNWKTGNEFLGTQESLTIWGVDGFEVANNTLKEGKKEGIDVKVGSRNGSLHNNTITSQATISGTPDGYNGGPALYIDGNRASIFNISIYNNTIYNNTADAIAISDEVSGQGDVSNIRVYNNVIYGNGRKGINSGAGVTIDSNVRDVEILHNTFFNNVQAFNVTGLAGGGKKASNITIRNNIMANSTFRNGFIGDADNVTVTNNLFTNGFPELFQKQGVLINENGSNNITGEPNFINSSGNDFHLNSSSPAINVGFQSIPSYASKDKDDITRPQNGGIDIGAYEYR